MVDRKAIVSDEKEFFDYPTVSSSPYGGPAKALREPYLGPNRGVWLSSADTPGTRLF